MKTEQSNFNKKEIAVVIDLSGEWIGYYNGHYDQVVRITQKGDFVEARKVTGDDYVPADEITFQADIVTGVGLGQVAEKEFRNARFVPGTLEILSSQRIAFRWGGCGEVEFRRDGISDHSQPGPQQAARFFVIEEL